MGVERPFAELSSSVMTSGGETVEVGENTSFTEGDVLTLEVGLDTAATEAVSVDVEVVGGEGAEAAEFTLGSSTLNFATGEDTKTTTLTLEQDLVAEAPEDFTIRLANPSPANKIGVLSTSLSATVNDDDSAEVEVSAVSETISEGETAEFVVSLSNAVDSDVVVDWSTSADTVTGTQIQTMAGVSDLAATQAASGSVNILAGSVSETVSIVTENDAVPEGVESLAVTVANPTVGGMTESRVGLGTMLSASTDISRSDVAVVDQLLKGDGGSPNVGEHDTVRVSWGLGGADTAMVASRWVGYVEDPGLGMDIPPDNAWTVSEVTEAGATSSVLSSLTPATSYLVRVGLLSTETDAAVVWGDPGRVTTSAAPVISLEAAAGGETWDLGMAGVAPSLLEGEALSVTATLNVPVAATTEITVTPTGSGSGLSAEVGDFVADPQTISIAAGSLTGSATVRTNVDADFESEVFGLAFSISNLVSLSVDGVNVTITEPTPLVSSLVGVAGDGVGVDTDRALTVSWDALSMTGLPELSGYQVGWLVKPGMGDPADSDWETVMVSSSVSSLTISSAATSSLSRLSSDTAYLVRVRAVVSGLVETWSEPVEVLTESAASVVVSLASSRVSEGLPLTVEALLDKPLSTDLVIAVTPSVETSDSAEDGDFSGTATEITITAGNLAGSTTIATVADTDSDDDSFTITPSTMSDVVLSPSSLSASIVETTMSVPQNPTVETGDGVTSSSDQARVFTISWDTPTGVMPESITHFEVGWVAKPDSGVLAAEDWNIVQTPDGLTNTMTITSQSGNDEVIPGSTYLVRVRAVLSDADFVWSEPVEITTADLPTVSVSPDSVRVVEGESATLTFVLSEALSADEVLDIGFSVAVPYTAEEEDFSLSTTSLTFLAGELTKGLMISTQVDDDNDDETLQINISGSDRVRIVNPSLDVEIQEPAPVVTVPVAAIVGSELSFGEGEPGTVTVRLSEMYSEAVVLDVAVVDVSTTANEDYTVTSPVSLSFAAGVVESDFSLGIVDDTEDEPDETLSLNLSAPTTLTGLEVDSQLITVTIVDNDDPPVSGSPNPGTNNGGQPVNPGGGSQIPTTPGGGGGSPTVGLPPGQVNGDPVQSPATSFLDAADNTHESNINKLAESGITRGCNPPANTMFCPGRAVTRGEMATFMVRAFELSASEDDLFGDDDGNTHESNINALAAAEITRGCNPPENTRYCPDRPVTRAQMATFLARAMELAEGSGNFADTGGSPHANDINRIAAVGITRGCNPPANTLFCPDRAVTRAEMATFLTRAEDLDN